MTWDSEKIVNVEFPKVLQVFEQFLNLQDRGFELIYSGAVPNSLPSILYQSNQCKVRIQSRRDRPYEDIEIYVSYSRLHAPLDKDTMEWNNEICYCWHRLDGKSPLLYFLDGQSPAEANSLEFIIPRTSREFLELSKGKEWTVPEHFARKHAFIWERYDQRLFDIFDLRYPDLWEEYINFLKEYCRISDEKSKRLGLNIGGDELYNPPRYKIC